MPGPAAVAIAQQRDRRVVTMDLGGFPDIGEQPLTQWRQQPCQFPCPAAHHIPIDMQPHAAEDHRLPMPGLMIDKAADDKMGQQGAARHHLGQRQIDSGCLADLFAGSAHQPGPDMADDAEARRDIVEDLSDGRIDLH